ncbi:hypothetical protein Acr_10g0009850 [Actinidia rufa]|uniref:Retrotransposon gag domain-containing protein n=1 Tax=Actinidia rufa TaxID=165716 RepID=A0A7J0FA78_9ERIC|nr:hypothetical protein Acr_10g0009850 [Actinidia rufa]
MHLRNCYLPRPSVSNPPSNKARPMANTIQAPDLEGLHREIHGMAEQMRVMNENNARLIQLLIAANPPPLAAPPIFDVERSRHSHRSGDHSQNHSTDRVRRGQHRSPSCPQREGSSSSSESSKTLVVEGEEVRRGMTPRIGALVTVDTLIRQTESLFTERILRARVSSKFKLPTQFRIYEGKTDPIDHLDLYKSLTSLQGYSDEVMCKAFSATLKGSARSWFQKLSPRTIDSFGDLSRLFVANFMSYRNWQKNASHLFTVHQKETDTFGSGGCLTSSRKRHARSAYRQAEEEIYNLYSPFVDAHPPITFNNDDLRGLHLPHDDALVVSAVNANFNV